MRITVYTIIKDEAWMLPYFLRHYATFADKIVVYDENSTDGSRELIQACPIAELREWQGKGLNDTEFTEAVNQFWKTDRAVDHWVMWPDVDELLHHADMRKLLTEVQADVIPSTGYALIAKEKPERKLQAYEEVKTGVRQENYDKQIIWRSSISMQHTIGRHTYPDKAPKFDGVLASEKVTLYHLHHIGGVQFTIERNARNFKRAVDKKYAWNYSKQHDKPEQNGSVAWVKKVLSEPLLTVVPELVIDARSAPIAPPPPPAPAPVIPAPEPKPAPPVAAPKPATLKVQFGCGGNLLSGWKNHDAEVDISKPLPYRNETVDFIYAEHCIEHTAPGDAWNFLTECLRILKPGGVLRLAFPDIEKMASGLKDGDEYCLAVKAGGHGDGSKRGAIRAALQCHGHKAAWSEALLGKVMLAAGFSSVRSERYGESAHPDLVDVENHWRVVGKNVAKAETGIQEATK